MTFAELQDQLDSDLEISADNISEKSMALARIYQKYLRLLSAEKLSQTKLEQQRTELYSKLYVELQKNGYDGFDVGKQKNNIDQYINLKPEYRQIVQVMAKNEIYIKHIELSLENIAKTSFNIANYISLQKLNQGIV